VNYRRHGVNPQYDILSMSEVGYGGDLIGRTSVAELDHHYPEVALLRPRDASAKDLP